MFAPQLDLWRRERKNDKGRENENRKRTGEQRKEEMQRDEKSNGET